MKIHGLVPKIRQHTHKPHLMHKYAFLTNLSRCRMVLVWCSNCFHSQKHLTRSSTPKISSKTKKFDFLWAIRQNDLPFCSIVQLRSSLLLVVKSGTRPLPLNSAQRGFPNEHIYAVFSPLRGHLGTTDPQGIQLNEGFQMTTYMPYSVLFGAILGRRILREFSSTRVSKWPHICRIQSSSGPSWDDGSSGNSAQRGFPNDHIYAVFSPLRGHLGTTDPQGIQLNEGFQMTTYMPYSVLFGAILGRRILREFLVVWILVPWRILGILLSDYPICWGRCIPSAQGGGTHSAAGASQRCMRLLRCMTKTAS